MRKGVECHSLSTTIARVHVAAQYMLICKRETHGCRILVTNYSTAVIARPHIALRSTH
eukprot:SAG25_NODE_9392_length_374_cov_0.934545_1_plen_57_part_01